MGWLEGYGEDEGIMMASCKVGTTNGMNENSILVEQV